MNEDLPPERKQQESKFGYLTVAMTIHEPLTRNMIVGTDSQPRYPVSRLKSRYEKG
jgi:hypothetical protein